MICCFELVNRESSLWSQKLLANFTHPVNYQGVTITIKQDWQGKRLSKAFAIEHFLY